MKIAIVMSGMLRNFEHTFATTKKYILDDPDFTQVDVFFAGYPGKAGMEYCEKKFVSLYNPRLYDLQAWGPKIEEEINLKTGVNDWTYNPTNSKSMNIMSFWRCRYIANELRKKYSEQNNIDYDLVYNLRTDFFAFDTIDKTVKSNAKQDNAVYVPPDWDFKVVNPNAIGDPMAVGSSDAMDKYFSLYRFANEYRKQGCPIHPETLLGYHFKIQNIARLFCPRNVAVEYPFSKDDVCDLWSNSWNKTEAYNAMKMDESQIKHRYELD